MLQQMFFAPSWNDLTVRINLWETFRVYEGLRNAWVSFMCLTEKKRTMLSVGGY